MRSISNRREMYSLILGLILFGIIFTIIFKVNSLVLSVILWFIISVLIYACFRNIFTLKMSAEVWVVIKNNDVKKYLIEDIYAKYYIGGRSMAGGRIILKNKVSRKVIIGFKATPIGYNYEQCRSYLKKKGVKLIR